MIHPWTIAIRARSRNACPSATTAIIRKSTVPRNAFSQDKRHRRAAGWNGPVPVRRASTSIHRRPDFTPERIQRLTAKLLSEQTDRTPQELADSLLGQRWRAPYQAWLATDPRERAQDLAFQAMEAKHPSQRRRLVRDAIESDPHCLDAVNLQWQALDETEHCDSLNPVQYLIDTVTHAEQQPSLAALLTQAAGRAGDHVLLRPYLRGLRSVVDLHLDSDDYPTAAAVARRLVELDGARIGSHAELLLGVLLIQGDLAAADIVLDTEIPHHAPIDAWARACLHYLASDLTAARIQVERGRLHAFELEDALLGDFPEPWTTAGDVLMLLSDHRTEIRMWVEDGCPTVTSDQQSAALASYQGPVAALLDLGNPLPDRHEHLAVIAHVGLTPMHILDLLRLADDQAIHELDEEDSSIWAPIYAVVALDGLRAHVPLEALLAVGRWRLHDEIMQPAVQEAIAGYGASANPPLRSFIDDDQRHPDERAWAGMCLGECPRMHPPERADIIALIVQVLERFARNSPVLNTDLCNFLTLLGATEAEPVVQAAYDADAVDDPNGDGLDAWKAWAADERRG